MYAIFSPTEGFWLTDFGWSYSPEECDNLMSHDITRATCLPGDDAQFVILSDYTHVDFDSLIALLIGELSNCDGVSIEDFITQHLGVPCHYLEDSVWLVNNKAQLSSDEIFHFIERALNSETATCASLEGVYNSFSENTAIFDDSEGFYHKKRSANENTHNLNSLKHDTSTGLTSDYQASIDFDHTKADQTTDILVFGDLTLRLCGCVTIEYEGSFYCGKAGIGNLQTTLGCDPQVILDYLGGEQSPLLGSAIVYSNPWFEWVDASSEAVGDAFGAIHKYYDNNIKELHRTLAA
jgi:hypothetical protein